MKVGRSYKMHTHNTCSQVGCLSKPQQPKKSWKNIKPESKARPQKSISVTICSKVMTFLLGWLQTKDEPQTSFLNLPLMNDAL